MDFKSYLEIGAQQIEEELEKILSEFLNETKKTNIKLIPFVLGLINSCKGGKRIRGVLTILGYQIAKGRPNEEIIKAGAAYEILHAAILVHDDIIDQSTTRRGQASLYKVLGGDHYGISQAISLGDIGLYLPIKIITSLSFSDQDKIKVLSYLSQTVVNTAWGEILDLEPVKDIILVNKLKTAQYTISGPLKLGAILAGANSDLLARLDQFGENLGIAYQIRDDILDGEVPDDDKESALEYAMRAKKLIPEITGDKKITELLGEMTDYVVDRTT